MSKIAIISLPLMDNCGGFLQAYALMETLRQMGHDVTFLQREKPSDTSRLKKIVEGLKSGLEKIGLGRMVYAFEKATNTGLFYKTLPYRQFTRKYIRTISPALHSTEEVKEYCRRQQFDIYITGSDQVWRKDFTPSVEDAFLTFAEAGKVRIGYAASLGTDQWLYSDAESRMISEALASYRAVSVREESGAGLLRSHTSFGGKIEVTLDPTLLLPRERYAAMAAREKASSGILCYIFNQDEDNRAVLRQMTEALGKPSFSVFNPNQYSGAVRESQGYSVEHWIAGFRDAAYVLTDSFHAVVFSLIFNKPFWVLENKMRGNTRLQHLLSVFHLENRIVSCQMKTNHKGWDSAIDWSRINRQIAKLAKESRDFLQNAIHGE